MVYTILGLAEYYLDRTRPVEDIKLVARHFKWMELFYTGDEMERLYLTIQLCETVRRYSSEFKLMIEHISESSVEPVLKITEDGNYIFIERRG